MLYRAQSPGVILITQPAHAWVSGQLARAWRTDLFEPLREETCLAAEQHDIGFLDWERAPTLNPDTGLPQTFLQLPTRVHLDLWTRGVEHMLRFGRLPALLVSMHFTNIARQRWIDLTPDQSALSRDYLAAQDALQASLLTSLSNDFHFGPLCSRDAVRKCQQLVSIWDWLSLLLCLGFQDKRVIEKVPLGENDFPLNLTPLEDSLLRVEPWPFASNHVHLACEGRRLLRTCSDEQEMRAAIKAAAPVTLQFHLVP